MRISSIIATVALLIGVVPVVTARSYTSYPYPYVNTYYPYNHNRYYYDDYRYYNTQYYGSPYTANTGTYGSETYCAHWNSDGQCGIEKIESRGGSSGYDYDDYRRAYDAWYRRYIVDDDDDYYDDDDDHYYHDRYPYDDHCSYDDDDDSYCHHDDDDYYDRGYYEEYQQWYKKSW